MAYDNTPSRLEAAFIQRDSNNQYYEQINISGSDLVVYLDASGSLTADKISVWAAKYNIGSGGTSNTSSFATSSISASYAITSSYAFTASVALTSLATNATSASWASSSLSASYAKVATTAVSATSSLTAGIATNATSASWASSSISSSYAQKANAAITANVALGTVQAPTNGDQYISVPDSAVISITDQTGYGINIFSGGGDLNFTAASANFNCEINTNGGFWGDGTHITNVQSATSSLTSTSASFASTASYAISASYAKIATTAGVATSSLSAGFATNATSASWASSSLSASFASTSATAFTATSSLTAGFSTNATSASWASSSISSSQSAVAVTAFTATSASSALNSVSSSYATQALTASYALNGGGGTSTVSASWASSSISSSYSLQSLSASYATQALTASYQSMSVVPNTGLDVTSSANSIKGVVFGAVGASHKMGMVPDPGTNNSGPTKYLDWNGGFSVPPNTANEVQSALNTSGINLSAAGNTVFKVSSTSAIVNKAIPLISGGTQGQTVVIVGSSDTNTLTFLDNAISSSGLLLQNKQSVTLGNNDSITLVYDAFSSGSVNAGGKWIESCRNTKFGWTGSFAVTSSISSSYATQALTASYALNGAGVPSVSASYALTASYALNGGGSATPTVSASWASSSLSASYAVTASYATIATTAVAATSAINAGFATNAASASWASSSISASYVTASNVVGTVNSSSYSSTSSYLNGFVFNNSKVNNITSSNYIVYQTSTQSFTSVFCDYSLYRGSNFRAGTIFGGWLNGTCSYSEYSTPDIGNTSEVTMSLVISSSFVQLIANVSSNNSWSINCVERFIS